MRLHAFNVAASIKMRKLGQHHIYRFWYDYLQCGRIYKDAEIPKIWFCNLMVSYHLQCGRIYKDAEIVKGHPAPTMNFPPFNVAASIKMRKSKARAIPRGAIDSLQCGRIYKDAEILGRTMTELCAICYLQCGRIYKDAEIIQSLLYRRHHEGPSMWPHL